MDPLNSLTPNPSLSDQATIPLPPQVSQPRWHSRPKITYEVRPSWHSVLPQTDDMASDFATIDLACMLAAFLQPKVIVEAGTYRGHMAAAVAHTLFQMGHVATIWTADPDDQGFGIVLADAPWGPMVQYHQVDYLAMLATIEGDVDLGFIDASSEENPHMRREHMQATFNRLAPGGILLVDDTAATDWDDAKTLRENASLYLAPHRGLSFYQKHYTVEQSV